MFKIILGQFSAPESALLRYGSALIAFVLVWLIFNLQKPFALVFSRSGFWSMLTLGALTFCIAPMLQMVGIDKSRATDGSLITALEPLTAVLLARIFLRERLGLSNVLSIGLALAGFVLLSEFSIDARAAGNLLILASCVLEGAYSVLGRKLLEKHGLVPLFGSSLLLGVVALLVTVTILSESGGGVSGFGHRLAGVSWQTIAAVIWVGPVGTCAAYFFWLTALKQVPVASVAVTLFIQPLLGALWGNWFMGDRLSLMQTAGAILILLSLTLPVLILNLRYERQKLI